MLPHWLTEKLATPPPAGSGVHAWLFSCARQLHAHMPPDEVFAALSAASAGAGRHVPAREIRDATRNSQACAWRGASCQLASVPPAASRRNGVPIRDGHAQSGASCQLASVAPAASRRNGVSIRDGHAHSHDHSPVLTQVRPAACAHPASKLAACSTRQAGSLLHDIRLARRCAIADSAADGICGLAELCDRSPVRPEGMTAGYWLDVLFPGAEWLCLARDHPATARTRRREKWSFGPADECSLIVPSPMTGPSGRGLDGRISHRCLGNTGPRRWLVIEFDNGTLDEQAALHWHLRAAALAANWPPLLIVVSSGKKSLHGWYGPLAGDAGHETNETHRSYRSYKSHPPTASSEERARALMSHAISLGADPATWNRCQLVRLPGGVRTLSGPPPVRVPLEVFYYEPHSKVRASMNPNPQAIP